MKRFLLMLLCMASTSAPADEARIRGVLKQQFPNIDISSVRQSPIAGLFEVMAGGKIFYIDQTGEYLMPGPLLETRTQENLTQKSLADLQTIKFNSLPMEKSVKLVRGKGTRKIAVFSDPDCPFSKLLLGELYLLDDLTVYVFLNPLQELHPEAMQRSNEIWCSADRTKGMLDYMILGKQQANQGKCNSPVKDILALSDRIGVNSTPVLIFENDMRVDGAMYANVIEDLLDTVYKPVSSK